MGNVKTEVDKAIKNLGFTNQDIYQLGNEEGRKLYESLLNHFVKSGDRRWWWEDFRQDSFSFIETDKPFELLNNIIPPTTARAWFMIEDTDENYYPIYDTRPEIIKDIIGNCFSFEYYIIDKNREWLICENHHNLLIGIGEKLKNRNLTLLKD